MTLAPELTAVILSLMHQGKDQLLICPVVQYDERGEYEEILLLAGGQLGWV
jgi:hypothetical protein